jgi:hypothetical protein
MKNRTEEELLKEIVEYFEKFIFENHINASLKTHSKLKNYKINPIVVKYLSKVLNDNYSPEGVAKALFYPRVLGTSINTIFGTNIQKMFVILGLAEGSRIKGIDIEFIDHIENKRKWCQLKSGPNTLNSEDVNPILKKFTNNIKLARTNFVLNGTSNNDFIVGVLYGNPSELSMHYKKIDEFHPVIIGRDFWYRITGFPNFYDGLVTELHEMIKNLDTRDFILKGCNDLIEDIRISPLFNF